ncbi:hypothetical protein M1L60_20250 [Actinoplanes sp. TRM 88003]|uniref:Uncharacterized protein n=1 Tax=Paractinoplanes aksuensis TaxID=2939490 RepID=A0ABT1DS75_9ACTN|nr:hypothetical protein [Actinoplanes aksuensis]MCO8272931.1 hypothetical protein [Actinoplanes aksuensis]
MVDRWQPGGRGRTRSNLNERQRDNLQAVDDGRSSSLDLATLKALVSAAGLSDGLRRAVRPDAGIYKPLDRLAHVEYWERQKSDLDQAMRRVGQENLHGLRDDLDLYEKIRNTMAGLLDVLRDMNTPQHDVDQLARAIEERLDRD